MNALEQALGRLALVRTAVAEADLERADLLLSELEDDLRRVPLDALLEDHACTNCGSDCNSVLAIRRAVVDLQRDAQQLAFALVESRELRAWAAGAIEEKFGGEERAA